MTVLHLHQSSLPGLSYLFFGGSGGMVNSAKEMRRQVSQKQDKIKMATHCHDGMLTAATLRSCTGFDRENCTSEHNSNKSDNGQSMDDGDDNMLTQSHFLSVHFGAWIL